MSNFTIAFSQALPKVALVTGGAVRLGKVMCQHLSQAGFAVAIHCRQSQDAAQHLAQQIQSSGGTAKVFVADLAQAGATQKLMNDVVAQMGGVGVLVNNASIFDFDQIDGEAAFDEQLYLNQYMVNTVAPSGLIKAFAQQIKSDQEGVVVNLLDQKLQNPNPDFFSYTLSKAALLEATRLAAMALAPRIRVLGIAPGISLPSAGQTQAQFEQAHRQTLLGRGSCPEDIAMTLIFAIANRAITGHTFVVDGGQHLVASPRDVMFG